MIIDFTIPAATAALAERAAEAGVALVVGTTGLGAGERRALERAAARIAIVQSPNMSVGVNVLFNLIAAAARALGDGFDLEIVEAHHRQKRDAPSGTALRMAEVLAEATGRDLGAVGVYGRHGEIGARTPSEIGVMTLRGGDVPGEHTAYFFGLGERIEITHRASSRETFARGAVRAALWLAGLSPRLYDMQDVLGLRRGASARPRDHGGSDAPRRPRAPSCGETFAPFPPRRRTRAPAISTRSPRSIWSRCCSRKRRARRGRWRAPRSR